MIPGLHPLKCSRCGAPLDPGDSSVGAVVRCAHCQQAHLWVAPDRVEAQVPARIERGRGDPRALLIGAVAVVAVLTVAGVVVSMMLRGRAGAAVDDRKLPADAPLVLGDQLEMAVQSKNSFSSCSFTVLGLEADGRVLGVPCGGTTPAPVSRELLRAEGYQSPDPGSIVLCRAASGWIRGEVIGPEPGEQVRLRALGEGGAESLAPRAGMLAVQRRESVTIVQAPLPASAPVEIGDLILRRDGAMIEEGKLLTLGDAVTFDRGSSYDGRFDSFKEAPKTASKLVLLARVVLAGTKIEPGNVLLAPAPAGWQRMTVVVEEPGLLVKVTAADGKEQRIVKQGLFLIRVADKTPPGLPGANVGPTKHIAPLLPGFRKCYQEVLAKHPKASGKVEVQVDVGATGEVKKADAKLSGDLPPSLGACMKKHALATKLDPPPGGSATYVMPVTFAGG